MKKWVVKWFWRFKPSAEICAGPYGDLSSFPKPVQKSIMETHQKGEELRRMHHIPRVMAAAFPTVREAGISAVLASKIMRGKKLNFIDMLPKVAERHVQRLVAAQKHYGDSWKKRGGVGAFMMMARKWDRIEMRLSQRITIASSASMGGTHATVRQPVDAYDIFGHIRADERPEGLADDLRDLIDYLLLVEAELEVTGGLAQETDQHGRPDQEHPFGHTEDES